MATKFLFRLLKDIDPQAQYDAIRVKDPFTLYFLSNGTGYLGKTKIFDASIFNKNDDNDIKNLVTDMLDDEFIADNVSVASTEAIVEYVKNQINLAIGTVPDVDALKELSNAIKEIQNSIPVIPEKLPADGGNADTVGGKSADEFASADHEHSQYALDEHNHDEYASKEHSHEEYASKNHEHTEYAFDAHEHDNYASKEHEHTEFALTEHEHKDYASKNHTHEDYASKVHEHTEFATVSHEHVEYALKDDVSDDIDAINKVIQQTNSNIKSNTDAITTLNGQGDGSIDKKITDAFNKFINEGSNDNTINTFKELLDYAADHDSDIQTLIGEITKNRNNLSDLTTILEIHKNNKENPHNVTLSHLGVDVLATELNFIKGAKSNVQEQLDDKAQKDHSHDISFTYEDVGADPSGAAASALEEAKKYTDELIAQQPQAQVQIITWEDDD